jgi:ComF family protein
MQALIDIFFPHVCLGCHHALMRNEYHLCTKCMLNMPTTNFHRQSDNPIEKAFWGRHPIHRAFAFLYFRKEGMVQTILHQIKYKGNQELAVWMGKVYGSELAVHEFKADGLVAVPLHEHKLRKRGYNQAALFAQGLSETTGIPDLSASVARITHTETQTKKSRFDRWTNVSEVFTTVQPELVENKHIVICDDVITTGATIEALCKVLPASTKISVCAIATPA